MTEPRLTEFDFETLSVLAKTDPGSFETVRRLAIERAIARAPAGCRQRLRRLQWRIDRVRETSRTPLAACVLISNMMWTSFNDLNRVYQRLGENPASGASGPRRERPLAAVVPLRPDPH